MYTNKDLFDFTQTLAAPLFENTVYPWEILPQIRDFILKLGEMLPRDRYENPAWGVWIAKTASVAPTAYLGAPVIVGEYAEVRHCAFVRGSALIGEHATVGNSTELKNVILFAHVEVPHYNYVGDSILGFYAHMGAGSITSNVKSDRTPVTVKDGENRMETGLKKFGAVLGDHVEVGCNSVLNPGTVVGRNSSIYPLSMVRGVIPADSIYKNRNEVVRKR